MQALDFRTVETTPDWYWHPWMYWLQHGGWFYFRLKRPVCVTVPRSRGWRWD